MKNLFMAAFIVAFTLTLQPANAQDDVGRWYLGGGIGQIKLDDYCNSSATITVTNCSGTDTGVKLYGGYNFHKNFAMEGGVIDFGELKATATRTDDQRSLPVRTSGNSFFAAGMGKIHVHPKATLFGKAGVHRWDVEVKTDITGIDVGVDDDGVDFFYGIGGEVAPFPNEKIKLRAEYEIFRVENFRDSGADSDFEFLSLGLTYTF